MPRFGVSMTRSGKQLEATAAANFDANGQETPLIIGTILAGLTRSDLDSIAGNQVPATTTTPWWPITYRPSLSRPSVGEKGLPSPGCLHGRQWAETGGR